MPDYSLSISAPGGGGNAVVCRTTPILSTQRLHLRIAERILCRCLNLQLLPGQCWGLLGRNGAGKTTMLHTLAGLQVPTSGRVLLEGRALTDWNRLAIAKKLGLLLQQRTSHFPATVESVVLMGRYPHLGPWQLPRSQDVAIAATALAKVGLESMKHRIITTLSGGEQQRVYLATILAQNPKILLLDEPLAHLDLAEQYRLLKLIRDLKAQGYALIMSLHNPNHALDVCDHLLLLHRGRALAGSVQRLGTARLLSRVFGVPLQLLENTGGRIAFSQFILV